MADFPPDYKAPGISLKYLVRVTNEEGGQFDETEPRMLWVIDQVDPVVVMANPPRRELLAGYGESRLSVRHIPVHGGAVQAFGQAIPDDHAVWLAGHSVPVDDKGGRFVAEEILPAGGLHTVEVAVLDPSGNGELYLRDLQLKRNDWFSVGIADLTLSGNKTNGPANLLDPDNQRYSEDFSMQGRLAFYSKGGKMKNGWSLTASADTREGPLDEIFSNFMDKTSSAQFRRMDPIVIIRLWEMTAQWLKMHQQKGNFICVCKKNETYALWGGNYKTTYKGNELTALDRELYGLKFHYQPSKTTSFGETSLKLMVLSPIRGGRFPAVMTSEELAVHSII